MTWDRACEPINSTSISGIKPARSPVSRLIAFLGAVWDARTMQSVTFANMSKCGERRRLGYQAVNVTVMTLSQTGTGSGRSQLIPS